MDLTVRLTCVKGKVKSDSRFDLSFAKDQMCSKSNFSSSARVQRFRMRLMRFDYTIVYVPGKEHVSADALSRALVDEEDLTLHEVSQAFVNQVILSLPASSSLWC